MSQRSRIIFSIIAVISVFTVLYLYFPLSIYDSLADENCESKPSYNSIIEVWKEYKPQKGHFSALLPHIPQHACEVIPIANSQTSIVYDMYVSQTGLGTTYIINVLEYPFSSENDDFSFERIIQEMMSGNSAITLHSKNKGEFLGCEAIDFELITPSGELYSKVFIHNKALYALSAIDINAERGKAFFEQFIAGFSLPQNS